MSLVSIGISGCDSTEEQQFDEEKVYWKILPQKAQANGVNMLCRQTSYISCFQISEKQCVEELGPFLADCNRRANLKVKKVTSREEYGDFVQALVSNLVFDHLTHHPNTDDETKKHIRDNALDQEQFLRDLLE